MIHEHQFNTRWWGAPVGVIDNPAFFHLPEAERIAQLAPFAFVEYRTAMKSDYDALRVSRCGFARVDTQIHFRIGLHKIKGSPSLEALEVIDARDERFQCRPTDMMQFHHERFLCLPGITPEKLAARYGRWSTNLAALHPEHALQISYEGAVQGWFIAKPESGQLNLTLAMMHKDARISGMLLYHKALMAFAAAGARIGAASFSVSNTDVLNMYVRLGALFLPPEACHIWIPAERSPASEPPEKPSSSSS